MDSVILFSAVGFNDPTNGNGIDGPMLHICRHKKPNIVYLYLTKDMVDRQDLDQRYSKFLEKLGKEIDHTFEIKFIRKPEITNPSLYNKMYDDLESEFEKLKFEPGDKLLINMSSGTPAITQSLQVLHALGKISGTLIQVPYKQNFSLNEMDIEVVWKKCQDQKEENNNKRIQPYTDLNLTFLVQEKAIESHIKSYNYTAAYSTACMLKNRTSSYIKYIEAAKDRNFLQFEKSQQVLKNASNFDKIFPVQDEQFIRLFEYIMYLKIKIERNEYTDFYRGISPIIFDLFKIILLNQNINISELVTGTGKYWSWEKIDDYDSKIPEGKIKIKDSLHKIDNFSYKSFVSSLHLNQIISDNVSDIELKKSTNWLRDIETQIRNPVAHKILIIDQKWINVNRQKIYIDEILQHLIIIFDFAYKKIDKKAWDAYEEMNKFILEKIKSS